jgi:hypothetical protein
MLVWTGPKLKISTGNGVYGAAHRKYGCGQIRLGLVPRGNMEGAEYL